MAGTIVLQAFNSLTWAMVLFLLSAGLTIVYGQMRVVNLAQGSFYLVGAYISITVANYTGNFVVAVLVGAAAVAVFGLLLERLAIRPLYVAPLYQVLMTYGLMLVLGELAKLAWGTVPRMLPIPSILEGRLVVAGETITKYRVAVIALGLVVAAILWYLHERTQFGAMLRAIVDDRQMAAGVGVNVERVGMLSFGLGAFLAALGGIVAAPIIAVYPGADLEILLLGFAVIIIGGAGSLLGAFAAALLVGFVDVFCRGFAPELSRFTIFGLMALVLAVRPYGLFGRP
jgi:branched-chain amino acid transport system permease protein